MPENGAPHLVLTTKTLIGILASLAALLTTVWMAATSLGAKSESLRTISVSVGAIGGKIDSLLDAQREAGQRLAEQRVQIDGLDDRVDSLERRLMMPAHD